MNEGHVESNANIVREGFDGTELQARGETASVAIAAAAKASIEARYILAMKRPRDWDSVRGKLMRECRRPGFADSAIYKKPVGKKKNEETGQWEQAYIEGLSVRFAEAAIRSVSNFYSSSTSIYDDMTKSIVRVTVMDLESNATIEIDVTVSKTVERRSLKKGQKPLAERMNSYGDRVFIVPATDDEVLNKTNALISKALRNGVLRLLPGDIQDDCEAQCRSTQLQRDKEDPDAAKKKLFDAFSSLGITPEQLKEWLGHTNQLQPAELQSLRGIYSAIRDGETTWAAVMDDKKPAPANGDGPKNNADKAVDDLVAKHKGKKTGKGEEPKPGDSKPEAESTDRVPGQEG